MHELTALIQEDMKPALGVTEPGAIAFAVATARGHVTGELKKISVSMNSGMYKNAFTCGIPNSTQYGNLYAAALGAIAARSELGLESLSYVMPEDDERARRLVEAGLVEVEMDHVGSEITIDAMVETDTDICIVRIRDGHTNIWQVECNGEIVFEKKKTEEKKEKVEDAVTIHQYSLIQILDYVKNVPVREIQFIRNAFSMNTALLEEGLRSERAVIAKQLLKANQGKMISEDVLRTAQLL